MKDRDPGIKLHPHPTFENRKARFDHLPELNLRWAFVGTSGSGKGVAMLDLLLRHYRGVFDRIYLYSKSSTIDKNWDPLKKYVERELGVDQREEKTFFDEFDAQALEEQMDLQMRVAEEAKKQGMKQIPQVLWIFDDLIDDERVMHNNSNLIATLAIRSRHFGGNLCRFSSGPRCPIDSSDKPSSRRLQATILKKRSKSSCSTFPNASTGSSSSS